MDKVVTLYDYEGNPTIHIVQDVENLENAVLLTVSGDEVLVLSYKDHSTIELDSCEKRLLSFYDGVQFININEIDQLNDPKRKKNT